MKILHLAHGPMQKLPIHFMELERRFGHTADLVYYQSPLDTGTYPVIPQPLLDYYPIRKYREWKLKRRVYEANRRLVAPSDEDMEVRTRPLDQLRPDPMQRLWRAVRDGSMRRRITGIISDFNLDGYDVVHFDGARDLTYEADLARGLKKRGAKIVNVFYGTELRVEGVTEALDELSDLNLTLEFDHLYLHPNIHFIHAPFELGGAPVRKSVSAPLRIVHAPSHRYNKGTDLILPVIEDLKRSHDFEFVLVEGLTQDECRDVKSKCDLCIDQVGNRGGTGYGVSSLEMFAMGIPCVSDFTELLAKFMPDHPFFLANPQSLKGVLAGILGNPGQLQVRGEACRAWLKKYHGYEAVYLRQMELYAKAGIGPK